MPRNWKKKTFVQTVFQISTWKDLLLLLLKICLLWEIWPIFLKRWKPVWLRAWLQWNHALRSRRYNDHSFDPNVRITELFYFFEDPVDSIGTSLLKPGFYGLTVVALTRFHCISKALLLTPIKYNHCVRRDLNSYFTIDFVEWIHASAHWSQEKQNRHCTHAAEARDGPWYHNSGTVCFYWLWWNPPENWVILIFSGQKPCTRII